MYKLFLFIFLSFFFAKGQAQTMANSAIVDQNSTELYFDENWTGLAKYGEKAIANGYDYFYLRNRIGIAYYQQKKYKKAVRHFEKAVKFNSGDKLALEYLYYSYIFSGRDSEARALTSLFPAKLRSQINPPKNKIIESVYCEGGLASGNLYNIYKNTDINGPANIYGEATITNSMQYWHFGLNHQLGNKLSIYHGYSNIKIDLTRRIGIYLKDTLDNYSLTQHDYYLSCIQQFKHFALSPAVHFINVNFGKLNASKNLFTNKYVFTKKDTSFINYASSVSLIKNIGIYTYNLSTGFAQLNGLTQIQAGLALTYYPFKNTNIYGTSSLVYLNENYTNRIISIQKVGFKVMPKLWTEIGVTYGNLQNYSENNAFVVFNTGDKILYKCGISITSPLLKHLEFSMRYDYFNRENTYYRTNDLFKTESFTINYKTQTIIGGVKWKI
ncbi:MAG: tetratricopeptide repeat protein [Bacteroidota bacterium]